MWWKRYPSVHSKSSCPGTALNRLARRNALPAWHTQRVPVVRVLASRNRSAAATGLHHLLGVTTGETRCTRASPMTVCNGSRPAVRLQLYASSVPSNSLRPVDCHLARLLCPWDFPGKNTGVGCHPLLQGTFPSQGSCLAGNPLLLSHLGSPMSYTRESHRRYTDSVLSSIF